MKISIEPALAARFPAYRMLTVVATGDFNRCLLGHLEITTVVLAGINIDHGGAAVVFGCPGRRQADTRAGVSRQDARI